MSCTTCVMPTSGKGGQPVGKKGRKKRRSKARRQMNNSLSQTGRSGIVGYGDVIKYRIVGPNNKSEGEKLAEFYPGISLNYLATGKGSLVTWADIAGTEFRWMGIERRYELTDVPLWFEFRMDVCCVDGGCAWVDVALGARTTPHTDADQTINWVASQEHIERDYLKACTRVRLTPGKCFKIPVPQDLRGQTIAELNNSLRGIIFHAFISKNCLIQLYMRVALRGSGCTLMC
nr:MAG: hypothetical protein [Grapevine umbra-like virus 3]WRQ19777.1 MAG: hypothetical protein [Grapevine umbra-like virus 3]WRQ19787.1 MAG: hypothetical protein [Grapevine umbra-like virus 3]